MILIPEAKTWHENSTEFDSCVVCGKTVRTKDPLLVHVVRGGQWLALESDKVDPNDSGDMGYLPIGSGCARKHHKYLGDHILGRAGYME